MELLPYGRPLRMRMALAVARSCALAGSACSVHMAAGFRVHFTQGPTVCRRPTAVTKFELEPKAAAASEKWLLALQAKPERDAAGP